MKTKLPTLLFLIAMCINLSVFSQPEVTSGNLPQTGDHVVIGLCSDIPDATALNASTGSGLTWDFSSLTEVEEQYFEFVDPASTPWGAEFPTATLCGISWDDAYSYYRVTGSSLNTVGFAILIPPSDTAKLVYTTEETIAPIPYSLGTMNTSSFSGTSYAQGFSVPFNGNIDFHADGDGTLILPNGTYSNVVKYHFYRTQSTGVTTSTKDQWAWVSEDFRFWLLLMETTYDGFNTTHRVWFDKSPESSTTSVQEIAEKTCTIFPNPVSSGSALYINTELAYDHLNLLDLSGRELKTFSKAEKQFHLDGISAGVYLLKMSDKDGAVVLVRKVRVI
ncbi:MAG TPA: T9SS type A sorting domain-containing protein [Bacteroidia bacterium]|nr:T9SS type A sorting domain-containing protein [Bacteroidia bacterium]